MARQATVFLASLAVLMASAHPPAAGQSRAGSVRGLLTGYATLDYEATADKAFANNFGAEISPTYLHMVGDNLLFEAETTFELEENSTSVHLEHAQIHYLGFDNVQITAGMMHVPFGIWMHTNWVNKMPTPPLLYEDTHGSPSHDALLPILFDVGVMARASIPVSGEWRSSAALWVTQGPSDEIPEDHHGGAEPEGPEPDAPHLGYGASFEDNNSNKEVGGMLRLIGPSGITVQGSGFTAKYDAASDYGVYALNLSLQWEPGSPEQPLFLFRSEGTLLGEQYLNPDSGKKDTANSGGYYAQLSRRVGSFEPIARWSQLPQTVVGQGILVQERRQLALGLDYWLSPSVPLKAAYQIELDGTDSILLQWVMGF